ncbi:MAG: ABC transporter permease [Parvibaculum sp.]|uniref:ABC transporter permease n=1 Tax=Parvibaculum sp. TaxID=2024848 RepID=UPI0025E49F8A|nr:ABC transporter permease [Parvibaculum sp.]MCE9649856.1 ABC transporter permease [Parvibaculum sp.]
MSVTTSASAQTRSEFPAAGVRRFGAFNWLGMWTLYVKEVRRFTKIKTQTVLAPMITTLLYLAVFSLSVGNLRPAVHGVPFIVFLAPGLIMMTMIQNAFANTSSAILISKVQGNVVDYLMPPLSPGELNLGIASAGVSRGLVVGTATAVAMIPFVGIGVAHLWAIVFFALGASLMLSLLGIIAGIWSEKFDHLQAVTNFVLLPLTFLSGTFYSVDQLPPIAHAVTHWNPVFYLIDGFRYGFTGHADGSVMIGVATTVAVNAGLWLVSDRLFRKGYRLKS